MKILVDGPDTLSLLYLIILEVVSILSVSNLS